MKQKQGTVQEWCSLTNHAIILINVSTSKSETHHLVHPIRPVPSSITKETSVTRTDLSNTIPITFTCRRESSLRYRIIINILEIAFHTWINISVLLLLFLFFSDIIIGIKSIRQHRLCKKLHNYYYTPIVTVKWFFNTKNFANQWPCFYRGICTRDGNFNARWVNWDIK